MSSLANVLDLAPRLIVRGSALAGPPTSANADPTLDTSPSWDCDTVRGRLVELSSQPGSAPLTAAMALIRRFQAEGEPAAWIGGCTDRTLFFPPDAAAAGVSLAHLPVIRLSRPADAMRAACHLLRSGGFGCAVIDIGKHGDQRISQALLSRLAKIAQHREAAAVVLTDKPPDAPSLGSLVSLRLTTALRGDAGGRFAVHMRAVKDKTRAPGWVDTEIAVGPPGLR